MECPACKNKLTAHKILEIKIEVCQYSCGGVWFDFSQIKKLKHLESGVGSKVLLFEKAEGVKTYRNSEHPCPNCKTTLLHRHFFSKTYETEVNQCSKCAGIWVDAGGLANIMISQKKENKGLIENYFSFIKNEKIAKMNLANQDIAEAAELITQIFNFLGPQHKN